MPCTFISYKKPPSSGSSDPLPPLQIGNGTSIFTQLPLYGLYDYSQGGMLYLAAELLDAGAKEGGAIEKIGFEFRNWDRGYSRRNQTIKISHVVESEMVGFGGYPDYRELNLTNTTIVKTFDFVSQVEDGWQTFDLTTPFIWNGNSNILVSWENHDGSWKGGYGWLRGDNNARNRANSWYEDDNYPTRANEALRGRPNLRINEASNVVIR